MLKEDLDEENQPSNPALNETIHQFLEAQRMYAEKQDYPPDTVFKCTRCGDCCRYNYYHLKVEDRRFLDRLHMLNKNPNGHWILTPEGNFAGYMPVFKKKQMEMISFEGPIPEKHVEFQMRTGRRHGYWVLTKGTDEIVVYYPVPCMHLIDHGPEELTECTIYADRPEICRNYSCRRYPVNRNVGKGQGVP